MTYLELINDVLVRLREKEVTSVTADSYTKLIGKYVNDIKTQVEDAYNWNALGSTVTLTTEDSVYSYVLTDAGQKAKIIDVINDTDNFNLQYAPTRVMNDWFLIVPQVKATPQYYNINGTSGGDPIIDIYPVPNKEYFVRVNMYIPQAKLTNASDVVLVPWEPIVLGAYAKAIVERGEDAGMQSSEAWQLYRSSLADAIAIESGNFPNELEWYPE